MKLLPRHRHAAATAGLLATVLGHASAQMHQICYEGPLDQGKRTIVVGCRDDAGGWCKVSAVQNGRNHNPSAGFVWPHMPTSMFQVFGATAGSLPVTSTVEFFDTGGQLKASRECTVSLGVHQQHGDKSSPGTFLEGFSTDASGLVMTGVWRASFTASGNDVTVPGDFIAISGGIDTSPGAFVMRSQRLSLGTWSSRSFDDAQRIPPATTTYAVGLKVQGLPAVDQLAFNSTMVLQQGLASLLQRDAGFSAGSSNGIPEAIPTAVALPSTFDRVGVAGDFAAHADASNSLTLRGQYATVAAPVMPLRLLRCVLVGQPCTPPQAQGWRAESKDDLGNHPGRIATGYWHLPAKLDVGGQTFEVRAKVVRSTSALDLQPKAAAAGLLGEYAITAVGGEVLWRPHNANPALASNRLTTLQPVMSGLDGQVASRHGSVLTPAQLTAYTLGIKLVKEGTPPEDDGRPWLRARDLVSPSWLCSAFVGLEGWRGCDEHKLMRLDAVCPSFPELRERDLCWRP